MPIALLFYNTIRSVHKFKWSILLLTNHIRKLTTVLSTKLIPFDILVHLPSVQLISLHCKRWLQHWSITITWGSVIFIFFPEIVQLSVPVLVAFLKNCFSFIEVWLTNKILRLLKYVSWWFDVHIHCERIFPCS